MFETLWREIKHKTSAPLEFWHLALATMTPNHIFYYGFLTHACRDEGFPNVSPSCFALWGSLGCPPATATTIDYGLKMAVTLGKSREPPRDEPKDSK